MEIILTVMAVILTLSNVTLCGAIWYAVRHKQTLSIPKPTFSFFQGKEPEETEEEKRYRILQENIENFDGTGKGQVKL